jgi:hypothetical protein
MADWIIGFIPVVFSAGVAVGMWLTYYVMTHEEKS